DPPKKPRRNKQKTSAADPGGPCRLRVRREGLAYGTARLPRFASGPPGTVLTDANELLLPFDWHHFTTVSPRDHGGPPPPLNEPPPHSTTVQRSDHGSRPPE